MKSLDLIIADYPEEQFLRAEGFDDCILGVEDDSKRLIYSVTACIEVLVRSGMSYQDSVEHFEFQVKGGKVDGPIRCYD